MNSHQYIVLIGLILSSCKGETPLTMVSKPGANSESVTLTQDHENHPVVVWTERTDNDLTLYYAASHDEGKSFSEPVSLKLSSDVATHAESMPKLAFRFDGSVFAAYERKNPTPENKYASAVCYVVSTDDGKTWSQEHTIHSDTTAGKSRSYFDIERLPDGEIGAAWLDIKLNQQTGGRSVRFAKTRGTMFSKEILIDSSACQCCRIDVYGDMNGRINVAYRGLAKGAMNKTIRDMMLAVSNDNGASFTNPKRISADNWAVDGCPHTGPSLCSNRGGLFSFWYTEGNGTGIYYNFTRASDEAPGPRQLVSRTGRHPQLSAADSRIAMVWEENIDYGENTITSIVCQTSDGTNTSKDQLSPFTSNAFLPTITQTRNGFLVAFLMETPDGVGVFVTKQ